MRVKKVLSIIIIGIVVSIISHSCFPMQHFVINTAHLYGLNNKEELQKAYYSINQLLFRIEGSLEWEYSDPYPYKAQINFINNCYATSQPHSYDDVIISSIKLTANKDIYFENDTIFANTDLWNNDLLKNFQWYNESKAERGNRFFYINFGFDDSVYQKLHIPNDLYTFEVSFLTKENKSFTISVELEYFAE